MGQAADGRHISQTLFALFWRDAGPQEETFQGVDIVSFD